MDTARTMILWRSGAPLPAGRPRTLPDLLAAAAARAGSAVVLVDGGRRATWPDLLLWSGRLAGAWAATVARGDRVAIDGPNSLDHLLAELACWRLGAIAVPLPPGMPGAVRARLLAELEPALVAPSTAPAFAPGPLVERACLPDDPCLILSTSGSTGDPRGVVLTHDNLCSQQAAFALVWPAVGPGDRLAAYLPWHHSFGGLAERLWSLCRGATLTLVPGGGRDHGQLVATVAAVRPTVFCSVPKLHRVMTHETGPWWRELRFAFTAGAALGDAEERFYRDRGLPVAEGWGLTECSPSATIAHGGGERIPGVVGDPIPGVRVGVREDGRVLVAGPGVMAGYWRRPADTARVLSDDVLDTGDLGAWTPGGLRLAGRADHTVKLANGEKVDLGALAHALERQPGVRQAVVFTPDGEALHALVADGSPDAIDAVNAVEAVPWRRIRRAWRLRLEPSVDNGLLTPSHKIARAAWLRAFDAGDVEACA